MALNKQATAAVFQTHIYLATNVPPHRQSIVGLNVKEREFFIDNLLVRIHFIIVMIRWTGLAPWEFESPFQGSLISITYISRRTCLRTARASSAW